jgi:hypothetical protein
MTTHAWAAGKFRLFITHVADRRDAAGDLRRCLQAYDVDAFVAHDTISPTAAWQDEIEDALRTCDACLAILSPGFKESDWCDQEVGVCVGRGALVLAIEDGVIPYGFIGKWQAFNPRRYEFDDLCRALYAVLRDHQQSRHAMAGALVSRFGQSDTYAGARDNMDRLKTIPREAWTDDLLNRVRRACDENRQIAEADYYFRHPVPVEVEQLVQEVSGAS